MSTTVEDVVSAIHSIGESYTYNDYVCIMLWIIELGPGGYDKVVYALEDVKSVKDLEQSKIGLELLKRAKRAFKRQ